MNTLAWHDGGPGPWILFLPLAWVFAVAAVVTVLRRTVWRRRGGPWRQTRPAAGEHSPPAVLGRRFASGEIDEEEYWRRMSVLEEHFARDPRDLRGGGNAAL
ncbi:SHOCT domain-containing protein [Streptomyces sp. IBSBF 2435]|uniref:SHOCT domain-containing protein n=1 Tax=Streptomyces sp. IBSBF 2435 TaxID=2903531 RepID=UPI002FDC1557